MVTATKVTVDDIRGMLEEVVDPDIPVLTIADIGILRDIDVRDDGSVTVSVTPTYSGCPAMAVIEEDIIAALSKRGITEAAVEMKHFPVWTTDWMSPEAKRKLAGFGIAPPDSTLYRSSDRRHANRYGCVAPVANRSTTSRRSDGRRRVPHTDSCVR
jgi:ring-1,2-phenylacetyl-CoA epoxidase subunit PaaD